MSIIQNPERFLTKPTGRPKDSPKAVCNNPEALEYIREKLFEGYNATGVWKGLQDKLGKEKASLANIRKIIQRMKKQGKV